MRKSIWLLSTGFVALSAPAFAQDATSTTAGGTPTTATEAATPTEESPVEPASTEDSEEVIVVTAQGRRQILQDVPISVTAVGGDAMQNSGANDIRQLNQLAPSLLVSSTSSEANGSARIRGIGTVGDNPGLESSVAVFIDGVYRSRSGIGLSELGEVDRVEVLRGPQGTLFGRNASAGLIHIFSKKPSFVLGAYGEASIGNYDYRRLDAGITGPISESLAFRLEGVWVKRDGFYDDVNNDTDVNNRNRWFTRGQLLFEPTDRLSVRLIGDYTWRREKCCGAVYVNNDINDEVGDLNNPSVPISPVQPNGNNIINVLTDLGQDPRAFDQGWSRDIWVTPGRSYKGKTTDAGLSMQVDYDFGGAELTSITGYRRYRSEQHGDIDFSTLDLWYRSDDDPNYRKFKTFSQELRLHGSVFNERLDWLVGGYFAHEKLTLEDTVVFGEDLGRFLSCRLVTGGPLGAAYNPNNAGCLSAGARAGLAAGVVPPLLAAGPTILAAIDRLDSISEVGSTGDIYKQKSRNWAVFTHNIFHVTDKFDVTVGLRYTNEKKDFEAEFHNNNVACPQNQAALGGAGFLNPAHPLFATAAAIISLSCVTNSTAELEGVSIEDDRKEDEFTGTGVLSYKPNNDMLFYASYSRGYKAGGFNLDRSALKSPVPSFASLGGAQALVGNLQFDPEIVDAYELGAKFTFGRTIFNVALFRQDFQNFQLNTFDGAVFIVQNVNGCSDDLGGADEDQSSLPGAPNFTPTPPGAAATGACDEDDVTYGVRSQGVELEASFRPMDDLRVNAGFTYASTKYRGDLVGTDDGAPLNPALRRLPGRQLSNAPKTAATGSIAWTPPIGGGGMRGLVYVDARYTGGYNTGSDLFPQKRQEAYTLVNARLGLRGADDRWAVELWAQNLFDKDYQQVAFNTPFQAGAGAAPFVDPDFPGGRQIFSTFLAEPRTYGLTLRTKFSPRARVVDDYVAPPPPPPAPPPPQTQTCPDGSVILATDSCPPPPPPPPPPPEPERG